MAWRTVTQEGIVLKTRKSEELYLLNGRGEVRLNTVTFKKPQVEKKTTQFTINSSSPIYFAKPIRQTAQKTENSRSKESPTSQVVRLTRYRPNFPSLKLQTKGLLRRAVLLPHDGRRVLSSERERSQRS